MTRRKNIALSFVCILIAILIVFWYFSRTDNSPILSKINNQPVSINSQTELEQKNLSVKTIESAELNKLFTESKLIDGSKVTSVEINFTSEQDPNATYVRADIPGQVIIATGYTRLGTKVIINIYAGPELTKMLPQKQAALLNFHFWELADLIAVSNLDGGMNPRNHQDIFLPL